MQVEQNFNNAASYIRSAAAQGVDLVVLPEYHLTNWVPKDPNFLSLCEQWEIYLKKYQNLAKECKICIVPGTIVERQTGAEKEDQLLNVAYFIDHTGEIIGKYIKKNLWWVSRILFSEGYFQSGSAGVQNENILPPLVETCTKSLTRPLVE